MEQERNFERVRSEVPDKKRRRIYRHAILLAIGGNVVLAIAKGLLAWFTGSSAVFSDAANSLSDTIYSVMMGGGLYLAQRPADESHPQGHERFEPLVSILIALAMGAAGAIALWQSIQRLLKGGEVIMLAWPTIVLVASMGVKAVMYFQIRWMGESVESPALQATAWDNLADILTSFAALAGVWGSRLILPLLDPAAGLLVALWIFRAAGKILWENLGYLTGRGAPLNLNDQIADVAGQVSGVEDVHQVIAEYVGPQLRVDIQVYVDGKTSLEQSHEIAENVRSAVKRMSRIDLVYVHTEPTPKN